MIVLVVATSNTGKFRLLRKLVLRCRSDMLVQRLSASLKPPEETEGTVKGNALLKATHYSQFVEANLLVCDDGLTLEQLPYNQQPGPRLKRVFENKNLTHDELFQFWWDRFLPGTVLYGSRERVMVFVDRQKNHFVFDLSVRVLLRRPIIRPRTVRENPLSYFLFPLGSNKSFAQMDIGEKLVVYNDREGALTNLLRRLS